MASFGPAERDADCPVSLDMLNELYRADTDDARDIMQDMSEEIRVRLALFCYNRSHLRKLALTIASSVEPGRLAELAGTMGEVLAAQCRATGLSFGTEPVATASAKPAKPKPKISLGGRG